MHGSRHYAVQGHRFWYHSKAHTTSYYWLIVTYLPILHRFQVIFAVERGVPHFNALARVDPPANIAVSDISLKTWFYGLQFCRRKYRCISNHFYVIHPESYRIRWNYAEVRAITPFKVIQGHRFWYQSKAHICDFLLVISYL